MQVDAVTLDKIGEISKEENLAFSWASRYLVAEGSSIIFLKNTSTTKNLIIEDIHVGGTAAATWELWTSTAAGAGTVISGTNLNRNSSNLPEASAFGNANITSNGSESLVAYIKHQANGLSHFEFRDALILGQNDGIMVKKQLTPADTVSGICGVAGYFE